MLLTNTLRRWKPQTRLGLYFNMKPVCHECGGNHEPSGARSDCIHYWKETACKAVSLIEWAQTLLCSATSSKTLNEAQSEEWRKGFVSWFVQSNEVAYKIKQFNPQPKGLDKRDVHQAIEGFE